MPGTLWQSQETEDYNAVMKSWGNVSGDKSAAAALRVERILINMQDAFVYG